MANLVSAIFSPKREVRERGTGLDVRESGGLVAGQNREQLSGSRSLDGSRLSEKGDADQRLPSPDLMKIAGSPHWHPTIQRYLYSDRRRIVAQVRRKVPKNRHLLAEQDSRPSCDDFLTTAVDKPVGAGL